MPEPQPKFTLLSSRPARSGGQSAPGWRHSTRLLQHQSPPQTAGTVHKQPWEQRAEKVAFAKRVFAEQYGRKHGTALDPERLTRDQLVLITLDYAENSRPYRRHTREAIAAGACPFLTGSQKTQLQGVLRVFERTFFGYVAGLLPEEHRKRWAALESRDRDLQGFCERVVPDTAERAELFARIREAAEGRRGGEEGDPSLAYFSFDGSE